MSDISPTVACRAAGLRILGHVDPMYGLGDAVVVPYALDSRAVRRLSVDYALIPSGPRHTIVTRGRTR